MRTWMLGPQGKLQPGPYVVEGLTRTLGWAVPLYRCSESSAESDQGCRPLTAAGDGIQKSGQRQDTWAQTA